MSCVKDKGIDSHSNWENFDSDDSVKPTIWFKVIRAVTSKNLDSETYSDAKVGLQAQYGSK